MANKALALIKELTGTEKVAEFQRALREVLLDAVLGINGSPIARVKAIIQESFGTPAKEILTIANDRALRDAYADVLHYGTPVIQAAKEAGVELLDLSWLISHCPLDQVDAEECMPSKDLRNRRL
jgi:hypothetical protein